MLKKMQCIYLLFISEEKNILAHIRELKDADYDGYIPAVKVDNPTSICIYNFIQVIHKKEVE